MTFMKLEIPFLLVDRKWSDWYPINDTNIIDAAVYWEEGGYIPNTKMCLSFQFKKHLSLGRGGMILTDSEKDYHELQKMTYDGRDMTKPWAEQDITTVGYHYYMTPETAIEGIRKFPVAKRYATQILVLGGLSRSIKTNCISMKHIEPDWNIDQFKQLEYALPSHNDPLVVNEYLWSGHNKSKDDYLQVS